MKIVIIHGSPRKGSTYNLTNTAKKTLAEMYNAEFTEFFLPQDAPAFCKGCFTCFYRGEDKCPDAQYIQPIIKAMDEADGFIVTSSMYALQISGGLKAFLDHASYCYVTHRPRFYTKKVLLLCTTAGAGIGNGLKYLRQNFNFWCVNRVYSCGFRVAAAKFTDIKPENRAKFEAKIAEVASKFGADIASGVLHAPSTLQTIMFRAIGGMVSGFEESNLDRQYWQNNGWLKKGVVYYDGVKKPNVFKQALQGLVGLMGKTGAKKEIEAAK